MRQTTRLDQSVFKGVGDLGAGRNRRDASDVSRRLESVPGIGVIGATAIAATITDPEVFKSGRRSGSLDRPRSSTELDRRQGKARWDIQAGRSISSAAPGGWSNVRRTRR
jgi:transposase